MTDEEKRIAIAEACGWTEVRRAECVAGQVSGIPPTKGIRDWVPRYLTDLNAMHEAEKTLTREQHSFWFENLAGTVSGGFSYAKTIFASFALLNATAAQRADAFLITKGLLK